MNLSKAEANNMHTCTVYSLNSCVFFTLIDKSFLDIEDSLASAYLNFAFIQIHISVLQKSLQPKITGMICWTVTEEPSQALCATGRRSKLPVAKPETPDISLWNLLYRNIGKDLTKISMPVTLNEPLSMLQVMHFQCSPFACWVVGWGDEGWWAGGGRHGGHFSGDPLPVLSARGHHEQFRHGQGCPYTLHII